MGAASPDQKIEFSHVALSKLIPLLSSPGFTTSYIPQANDLDRLLAIVRDVKERKASSTVIAASQGVDKRQASYYLEAARELRFVRRLDDGRISLTNLGLHVRDAQERESIHRFSGAVLQLPVIREAFRRVLGAPNGVISRSAIASLVSARGTKRYGHATLARRTDCVISWLKWLENTAEFSVALR